MPKPSVAPERPSAASSTVAATSDEPLYVVGMKGDQLPPPLALPPFESSFHGRSAPRRRPWLYLVGLLVSLIVGFIPVIAVESEIVQAQQRLYKVLAPAASTAIEEPLLEVPNSIGEILSKTEPLDRRNKKAFAFLQRLL